MKFTFLSLAIVLANACLAARPVVETERMMKENAYQGVWLEKHHDEALKVAFSTNGWMIVDYRGLQQLFRWKSNGKGLIELAPGEKPEKTVMKLKYLPKQDIMDCGFEGKTTQLDFTGLLAFKSTELSKEHADALREATAKHERYREERFERLKKSADPRLRRVENLNDVLDPNWLFQNKFSVKTVDLEYPQVITTKLLSENCIFIDIFYGAHEKNRIRGHEIHNFRTCASKSGMAEEENEIGIPRAEARKALCELVSQGIDAEAYYCVYGSNGEWREDAISCCVSRNNRDKAARILQQYFGGEKARCVLIEAAILVEPDRNSSASAEPAIRRNDQTR